MPLDTETVLWALRGLEASCSDGVTPDGLARFLSADATLGQQFSVSDVSVVLDALVVEGSLTRHSPLEEQPSSGEDTDIAPVSYRLAPGFGLEPDVFAQALAEQAEIEREASAGANADAFLRLRVDVLERERAAVAQQVDDWREKAEATEHTLSLTEREADELRAQVVELRARVGELERLVEREATRHDARRRQLEAKEREVADVQTETHELRTRLAELTTLLHRERVLNSERSTTTNRVTVARARVRHESERSAPSGDGVRRPAATSPSRPTFRGNWLQ